MRSLADLESSEKSDNNDSLENSTDTSVSVKKPKATKYNRG
jgi:hypothetical protein